MTQEHADRYRAQLDAMRQKVDELKVKGHLLKMELRSNQGEVVGKIESAYGEAKTKLEELAQAGEDEAEKLGAAFRASYEDATGKDA